MPLNFTEQELDLCVDGLFSLGRHLRSTRSNLDQQWKIIKEMAANVSVKVTKDQFFWARFVSFSRTFTASRADLLSDLSMANGNSSLAAESTDVNAAEVKESVFAPLADMINHASERDVNCDWRYKRQKGFVVVTKRPLIAGEELFISYGSKPNDMFLSHYGFVEHGNPRDAIEVMLPLPKSHPKFGVKMGMPLRIDGALPAEPEVVKTVLAASRMLARRKAGSANIDEAQLESLALGTLLHSFEEVSEMYAAPAMSPSSCMSYRESQKALLGTWLRFTKAALAFLSGSWPPEGSLLPENLEVLARSYFGIWLGTLGKELQAKGSWLEAFSYGNVSYSQLLEPKKLDT